MTEPQVPYHPRRLPIALVRERASRIKLICFDVDGTLTDGRIGYAGLERVLFFNSHDGHGIRKLHDAGLEVAWITANKSAGVADRAKSLRVKHLYQGQLDKETVVYGIINDLDLGPDEVAHTVVYGIIHDLDLGPDEVAYMGDDENDVAAMMEAGLAVAPATAHASALAAAHYVTEKAGGMGAARELCDLILSAQGK